MSLRGTLPWILATLVIAAAVHLGSMWYLPHVVMSRAMAQMGAVNTIHHAPRATAAKRGVVRPSPDLLYSVCPFDVSNHPLHVTAPVPPGTYWSMSIFDDKTNNFFVLNDSKAQGAVDFLIVEPGQFFLKSDPHSESGIAMVMPPPGQARIPSPSDRGLVVFRTLIDDENKFKAIDAARRKANCVPG